MPKAVHSRLDDATCTDYIHFRITLFHFTQQTGPVCSVDDRTKSPEEIRCSSLILLGNPRLESDSSDEGT